MAVKKVKKRVKKRRFDVICVGSANVDCFVNIPVDFKDIKHGSKLLIDDIFLSTGGGASNVAVGLSRLGLKAGFIGEVGEDLSADMVRRALEKEKVEFLVKQHSRHQTAYSVVLEAKGKDRAILVYKGASSFLHPQEIPKDLNTEWFYFASVVGESFKTMERIAGIAKKKNIKVFFNPSSYLAKKGQKFLKRIISATTVISMNKEEAQAVLNTQTNDIKRLLDGLNALGPAICIITDGKKGAHAYFNGKVYSRKAHNIRPVDTTGAGDAFGTGFLAGLMMKRSLPEAKRMNFAMKLGMANSESVIMRVGAKTGLITRAKVNKK